MSYEITHFYTQKITVSIPTSEEETQYGGVDGIDGAPDSSTHPGNNMLVTKRLIASGNNQVWYENIQ